MRSEKGTQSGIPNREMAVRTVDTREYVSILRELVQEGKEVSMTIAGSSITELPVANNRKFTSRYTHASTIAFLEMCVIRCRVRRTQAAKRRVPRTSSIEPKYGRRDFAYFVTDSTHSAKKAYNSAAQKEAPSCSSETLRIW